MIFLIRLSALPQLIRAIEITFFAYTCHLNKFLSALTGDDRTELRMRDFSRHDEFLLLISEQLLTPFE